MSLKKFLTSKFPITNTAGRYSNKLSYGDLVNAESEIGRTIFGPIPEGHQREFFESKKNVWIWYEGWSDPAGILQEITICYEVRPAGVYKRVGNGKYERIEGKELDNFVGAARKYFELVRAKLYC